MKNNLHDFFIHLGIFSFENSIIRLYYDYILSRILDGKNNELPSETDMI